MTTFLENVRSTIARHSMFSPGDAVVVAVSGGADSMALLHALASLREALALTLHVAHLDHQLRPGSADDAGFVVGAARALHCPCTVGSADVRRLAADQRRSLEDAARRARYGFLARVAGDAGADAVATAHTHDDQVETVLMRLLDGAAWESLAGIPPARPLDGAAAAVVRPLGALSRGDVLAFLEERGVSWREDPTNRDLTVRRNWVRHAVLPAIEAQRRGAGRLLSRAADTLREADRLLTAAAGHVFEETPAAGTVRVPLAVIRELPPPVRRRLVRKMLAAGTDGGASRVVEDEALELLSRRRPGQIDVGGRVVRKSYEALEIAPAPGPDPRREYELTVPGDVVAAEFGILVRAELVDPGKIEPGPDEVMLDADAAGPSLRIRPARPGDRVRPLGMKGNKKVQDLLVDEKVLRWERGRIPLIVGAGERILWVVGLRISDEARITERTQRAVRLRVLPVDAAAGASRRA